MKSENGHRKYVFVMDIALRFRLQFRAFLQAFKTPDLRVLDKIPGYLYQDSRLSLGMNGNTLSSVILPHRVLGACQTNLPLFAWHALLLQRLGDLVTVKA